MYSDINFSCRRDFKRNGCKTIDLVKLNSVNVSFIVRYFKKDKKKSSLVSCFNKNIN